MGRMRGANGCVLSTYRIELTNKQYKYIRKSKPAERDRAVLYAGLKYAIQKRGKLEESFGDVLQRS